MGSGAAARGARGGPAAACARPPLSGKRRPRERCDGRRAGVACRRREEPWASVGQGAGEPPGGRGRLERPGASLAPATPSAPPGGAPERCRAPLRALTSALPPGTCRGRGECAPAAGPCGPGRPRGAGNARRGQGGAPTPARGTGSGPALGPPATWPLLSFLSCLLFSPLSSPPYRGDCAGRANF